MGAIGADGYQVELPVFEGPLDLLLHLIERQELDITQVSLAAVTGQYLDYLTRLPERDADGLAAFLVVAARLILIKSRVLLPRPPAAAEEATDDDVGQDLVRQLMEYRLFKGAAQWLRDTEARGLQAFVRTAVAPHVERSLDLEGVSLESLLAAVRAALDVAPPLPSVDGPLPPLTVSISERIDLIAREVAHGHPVSFLGLLGSRSTRLEIVVTLLAVLEMVKQRRLSMHQPGPFGDILLTGRTPQPLVA